MILLGIVNLLYRVGIQEKFEVESKQIFFNESISQISFVNEKYLNHLATNQTSTK